MKIQRIFPDFVSLVHDLDLSRALPDQDVARLRTEFLQCKVLILPSQEISPRQYIAFCGYFGKVWRTDDEMKLEAHFQFQDYPELVKVSNHHGVLGPMELEYHADGSHHPSKSYPTRGLFAWSIPKSCAGSTTWLDMTQAYALLPETWRQRIANLKARHIPRYSTGWEGEEVFHPLVRVHPISGIPSLSVDTYFTRYIEGLAPAEGQELLAELLTFAKTHARSYTHSWSRHDIVVFDNNNTVHRRDRVLGAEERLLLRTTLDLLPL